MDEWRRNNPCFLDMHVGHAARDHRLSHKEWDGPLGERWHKNREAWNAVRNLAPFKTPEEIAATFKVDISKWKPTSNIELLIDVAETMANETRLWDGTPTTEPPAPKNHKWPDNMRPVLRSSGPASTKGGTVQASGTMVFSSSPTQKTRKPKKSQKRKFLVSPEISRSVPSEAKALPLGKPNEVTKDETATRDATNALEDTSRCLFREKDALAETVEKHGQEIHNIHNTLWNVHAQIANLRLDNARSKTLSRILLENAGIPEQLITQRLAAANSAAQAQIESQRLQSTRLQLTGAATDGERLKWQKWRRRRRQLQDGGGHSPGRTPGCGSSLPDYNCHTGESAQRGWMQLRASTENEKTDGFFVVLGTASGPANCSTAARMARQAQAFGGQECEGCGTGRRSTCLVMGRQCKHGPFHSRHYPTICTSLS